MVNSTRQIAPLPPASTKPQEFTSNILNPDSDLPYPEEGHGGQPFLLQTDNLQNLPQHQSIAIDDPPSNPLSLATNETPVSIDIPPAIATGIPPSGPSPADIKTMKEQILAKVDGDELEHIKEVIKIMNG